MLRNIGSNWALALIQIDQSLSPDALLRLASLQDVISAQQVKL